MEIIKFIKAKGNKYKVELDTGENLVLYDDVIIAFNLLNNKQLNAQQLIKISQKNNELDAYYRSIKYLSIKLRTKKEMESYLLKSFDSYIVNQTINRLINDGYLNNKQYLTAYLNDQINLTANGPQKIYHQLINLGISEELINQYISEIKPNVWLERINKIINKKIQLNHKLPSYIFKQKLQNDLFNLGYDQSLIKDSLNNIELKDDLKIVFEEGEKLWHKYQKTYKPEEIPLLVGQKLFQKGFDWATINQFIASKKD